MENTRLTSTSTSSPTRVAVVGGAGQVARLLHPLLIEAGVQVTPLVRRSTQLEELRSIGADARLLDIEQAGVTELAEAFDGCDAVVFAAGGGPDGSIERKRTVDLLGSIHSVEAAIHAGISRFIQVSGLGVDAPLPEGTSAVWRAYIEAKRDADAFLRGTDLAWTILRPGELTDDKGTGHIALEERLALSGIPRADVAATLAEVLLSGLGVHRQWDLVSGDEPIADAVGRAGEAV